ncbi:hypothetical protein [Lichenihabitans psoromatis]|uniref:hypothetical protein n=1 Tax=Lichenihabitans psoromatis TaxID=2528642 RepID=UPI0010366AFE|nr:hypothetical protein [Lichenihabitans psoromatis]
MTERSDLIETASGAVHVSWSTSDGVVIHITQSGIAPVIEAEMHLTVEQAYDFTSILLAACRTAGSELKKLEPDSSDELLALAERLRSDQQNLTPVDLRVAAGYLELLLKFGPGMALNAREE